MGLQDHEERELAEIEQHLKADDPQLGGKLTGRAPLRIALSGKALLLGGLTTYLVGLVTIIGGVSLSSVILIVLGAIVTASFPITLLVRAWFNRTLADDEWS